MQFLFGSRKRNQSGSRLSTLRKPHRKNRPFLKKRMDETRKKPGPKSHNLNYEAVLLMVIMFVLILIFVLWWVRRYNKIQEELDCPNHPNHNEDSSSDHAPGCCQINNNTYTLGGGGGDSTCLCADAISSSTSSIVGAITTEGDQTQTLLETINTSINERGNTDVEFTDGIDVFCTPGGTKWKTYYERKYDEDGNFLSSQQYWTDGFSLLTSMPTGLSPANCGAVVTLPPGAVSVAGNCVRLSGSTITQLPVAPGTQGNIKWMSALNSGFINFSLNGSAPTSTSPKIGQNDSGPVQVNGVDLSLLRFKGQNNNTEYTVCYEAFLPP